MAQDVHITMMNQMLYDMNKYLKFEYWNECDLGNIYYQGGQTFLFYLDGDVLEPFHEDTEEGQENGDGDFIPTYRKQMKRYRIRTMLVSDYLVDAVQRMKMHDHIELTFKTGEVERIYNLDVEPEWQFEKHLYQATMVLTFDMDESITVGACCDNLVVGTSEEEPEPIPDFYWVAENGSNLTGDGSYARPWATLAYACSQATTPGDVIHVKAGTITETIMSELAIGVSIVGAGATSIITTAAALNPIILARSTSEGDNGNQTISYIKFDGNTTTALRAIVVNARSNFEIHHCTFVNFLNNAVRMTGQTIGHDGEPSPYATGNKFYSNTITNCAGDVWSTSYYLAGGAVEISGQSGMLIHDNYIDGGPRHGYGIKGVAMNGYHKGLKIYNNVVIMNTRYEAKSWNFAIELWSQRGGVEIYDNRIVGAIDLGGLDTNDDGGYGYAAKIYRNDIGHDALPSGGNIAGIAIESGQHGGLYIYQNRFHHIEIAINCQTASSSVVVPGQEDIYIYYNLFHDLGLTSGAYSGKVLTYNAEGAYTSTWDNIQFINNTVYNPTLTGRTVMDCEDSGNTFTNIVFRNNICQGFYNAVKWDDGTVDGLSIENNLTYLVTNLHDLTGVSNDIIQNNVLATDPAFVTPGSDFHLQAGSDAIDAGISTGLAFITTDYEGDAISDPPEIGAYEY